MIECPDCGKFSVKEQWVGLPVETVAGHLVVLVPLMTCEDCGFSYTDWRGEKLIDEAAIKCTG